MFSRHQAIVQNLTSNPADIHPKVDSKRYYSNQARLRSMSFATNHNGLAPARHYPHKNNILSSVFLLLSFPESRLELGYNDNSHPHR